MRAPAGIHYSVHRVEGNPKRPPIILIHGAGGNRLTWHPYIRRLAGETVYALDLPGHGESEGAGRNSVEEYAGDVLKFINEQKIQKAVLGGISMGSAISLTLAVNHPEKVAGLMLIGGGAKMRVANSILDSVGNSDTFEAAVEMINTSCFSANAPQDLLRLSKQILLKTDPSVLLGDFLACNQFDLTGQLSAINVPVLILCGAEDKMMPPKFSESLRDNLPNARLQIVKRAGHMLTLEQPDAIADSLKRFMDDLPPQT